MVARHAVDRQTQTGLEPGTLGGKLLRLFVLVAAVLLRLRSRCMPSYAVRALRAEQLRLSEVRGSMYDAQCPVHDARRNQARTGMRYASAVGRGGGGDPHWQTFLGAKQGRVSLSAPPLRQA